MIGKIRSNFIEYHKDVIAHWKVSTLIEQEKILGELIDSDCAEDFVLIDEVILLYDLVRDECVKRLSLSCSEGD